MTGFTRAPLHLGVGAVLLATAGCEPPRDPKLVAAYGAPQLPEMCREEVYNDPKVHEIMIAGAALPGYRAEHQDELSFQQDRALQRCLQAKGLQPMGGVEPVRYKWYPPLF